MGDMTTTTAALPIPADATAPVDLETVAQTYQHTGWKGAIPRCPYCRQFLTTNEFDWGFDCDGSYPPGWYSAHSFCSYESPTGRWAVIVRFAASGRTTTRRFNSRQRAVEDAQHTRDANPLDRPCGQNLRISVAPVLS